MTAASMTIDAIGSTSIVRTIAVRYTMRAFPEHVWSRSLRQRQHAM
jgi:hypothetical protein